MSRAVVVLWLGAASLRTNHEPDLASWADSRQVTLEELAPDAPLPPVTHDDAVATRIEILIADALSVAEPEESATPLKSAEELLRAHPELPESAWLMAEILRIRGAVAAPGDAAEAAALERRADALEGVRTTTFDPRSRASTGGLEERAESDAETSASQPLHFAADGPLPTDQVYVDGVSNRSTISMSEHHVRVVRGSGLAWAGWIDAADLGRIRLSGTTACSATDLGAVRGSGPRVVLGHAVVCPEWAVARAADTGRIEVARCHGSDCGTFLPWRREWGASFEMPVHPKWPKPKSNTWIFWTAAAVAAAATTSVVLWQAGVFEKTPETVQRIDFRPPK